VGISEVEVVAKGFAKFARVLKEFTLLITPIFFV